jgi:hypothetical protein
LAGYVFNPRKVSPLIWASVVLKTVYRKFLNYEICTAATLKRSPQIKWHATFGALCCWDITFRPHTTAAKFIIKSSLFVQMFKGASQAETEDCLCF